MTNYWSLRANHRRAATASAEVPAVPQSLEIALSGVGFTADPSGALYWPEHGLLAVSDLHLEKGSSYAARGQLLPPYDTAATLARLTRLIEEQGMLPRGVFTNLLAKIYKRQK